MARILIWQNQQVVQNIRLYRSSSLIGRANECEIHLDEKSVSRRHARVTLDEEGYFLEDLGSQGGVYLNKTRIQREPLQDGDLFAIPPYLLQFVIDVEAEAKSAQRVVEVREVSKRYTLGEQIVTALSNVSIVVFEGEFLALAGPSGSGKSTLLNMIGCIDSPTEGSILIQGQDISARSADDLADLRLHTLGFVFQTFNLLPVLSAWENVEYPLMQMRNLNKVESRQRVEHALKVVGLERFGGHRPNELSGGQRQRVAIARALATKPKIILADEPTANLDRKTGGEILALMRELNQQEGVTFIFSTHDPRVMEMADRVIELSDGQIVE